ncbi:MAG: Rieske 2Fe-2S domain-containing protein [Phycisphaerales bacterium]|nr:MAG: Rieske 2Fe-2S domain-containing protein [Phycisphaerales bacterium]
MLRQRRGLGQRRVRGSVPVPDGGSQTCRHCGKRLKAKETLAGKQVICPAHKQRFTVGGWIAITTDPTVAWVT